MAITFIHIFPLLSSPLSFSVLPLPVTVIICTMWHLSLFDAMKHFLLWFFNVLICQIKKGEEREGGRREKSRREERRRRGRGKTREKNKSEGREGEERDIYFAISLHKSHWHHSSLDHWWRFAVWHNTWHVNKGEREGEGERRGKERYAYHVTSQELWREGLGECIDSRFCTLFFVFRRVVQEGESTSSKRRTTKTTATSNSNNKKKWGKAIWTNTHVIANKLPLSGRYKICVPHASQRKERGKKTDDTMTRGETGTQRLRSNTA